MNDHTKLILALQQIDNVISLTKNNIWEEYMLRHLSVVKYELERQLTNLKQFDKIESSTKEK
jgi:hypothetical protein|tara:strand:- start:426 stop:611 length:186 start_codon:yes stop_codon:yes gene_type:complete